MDSKLRAVSKLQKIAEKQREQQGMLLEQLRHQAEHYQQQLELLGELHSGCAKRVVSGACSSVVLQNTAGARTMLAGALNHHRHEKAVLDAECEHSRKQLEVCHAKVKGLENVVERWQKKQQYEQARQEQKRIEEIINARYKKSRL
ncbi:flagellar export protein FliJ [Vibrio albus]|uniref:flagellar export protein FliJ n=1 Tax=Vibrio albus TaxID=2200953 RepID=UPI0015E861AF|nr:flagellar export protein FliJ [Vibrio albus]